MTTRGMHCVGYKHTPAGARCARYSRLGGRRSHRGYGHRRSHRGYGRRRGYSHY